MTEAAPILIPLVNPNEPGARLADLPVVNGQHVIKGQPLCTLETTKATVELTAEQDGYLVGLTAQQGQTIQAGEVLAYLAGSPEWQPPSKPVPVEPARPGGLRISQAALRLAEQYHVDLSGFSGEQFVTEKMVQELIDRTTQAVPVLQGATYQLSDILIYGGGGHGKMLIDLIRSLGTFSIAGVVDDGLVPGTQVMGVTVLGGANILGELYQRGLHLAANAVGGIGNITSRINVFERLSKAGYRCPVLVHPSAFVEPSAALADGVQVFAHGYVGSQASVGFGGIVNTGAIISHDCMLGEYVNLSPGAILAGEVSVGMASLIGMGVTVNLRVRIGERARIGNGATVKQDVPENGVVRAGTTWPD